MIRGLYLAAGSDYRPSMRSSREQHLLTGTRGRSSRFVAVLTATTLIMSGVGIALAGTASAVTTVLPPLAGTVGSPIGPVSTVDLTGLVAPVTLTITPPLPTGLAFDAGIGVTPGTAVVSGTPTQAIPATTYTVTATDSTPVTPVVRAADLTITIDGLLTPPSPITAMLGQPLTGSPAFSIQGLGAPLAFAAPTSPAWLLYSASGSLSGTPDTALPPTTIPVTVTDPAGAKAVGSFSLAVVPALSPATQSLTAVVGTPLSAPTAVFPAPVGASYVITPAITPLTGLAFDPSTGVVSGTPTHPVAPTVFAVQLQATSDGSVLAQGVIDVTIDGVLGTVSQVVTGTVGSAIIPFIGYGQATATTVGLVAPFAYTTTPALPGEAAPGDLSINPSTGAITGRPASAAAGSKYVVTVTDANGAKASGPITVTVAGLLLPATQSVSGAVGTNLYSKVLVASGMVAPVTFAVTSQLPAGLLVNAATGVVSGIPRAVQATTLFEISATDANGATGRAKVTVTIGKAALSPPIIGSVLGGAKAGSLRVFFTAPRLAPTGQTYSVLVYDSTGVDLVTTVDASASPVIVEGLTPGETYQVVVVANATTSFDRVESQPKAGVAALSTTTGADASVALLSAAGTATPTTAALRRAGFLIASDAQAATARRVVASGPPTRALRRAPVARVRANSFTRIVVPGVMTTGALQIRVRVAGAWLPLGTARADERHQVGLPAFAARRVRTYPIQIAGVTGRPLYLRLVVGPPAR